MFEDVPKQLVGELAGAHQFARACESRWSVTPEQLDEIRHFIALYEEDVAWSRPASAGGTAGLQAPASGWPEWKVTSPAPPSQKGPKSLEGQELFKLLAPSVFRVDASLMAGTFQGSAVAVAKDELLTNCHVVEGAQTIVVRQDKKQWSASLLRADPATDRCVLRAQNAELVPVGGVRPYSELQVGEPLFTLGSPNGLELSIANGMLSGLRVEDGRSYVQTTAPISPGSSGGGLFDARGNLVGITTLVLVGRERLNQSLNFAIPADLYWK